MSSQALQDNSDDSVGLYQDFIVQSKPTNDNDEFNVSGIKAGGGGAGSGGGRGRSGGWYGRRGRGRGGGRGDGRGRGGDRKRKRKQGSGGDVKDHHYSPAEYAELNSEQKSKLKLLCIAREDKQDTISTAQLLTKIATLEKRVLQAENENEGGNENNQDAGNTAGNANCSHSALKKPK
jgi:hypothetical protein